MLLVCLINAMQDTGISSGHVQSSSRPLFRETFNALLREHRQWMAEQCRLIAPRTPALDVVTMLNENYVPITADIRWQGQQRTAMFSLHVALAFLSLIFTFSFIIVKLNFEGRQHNFSTISNESI